MLFTSESSGNWSVPGTWAQPGIPGPGDTIQINPGNVVTLTSSLSVGDAGPSAVVIELGGVLALTANITLTIYGAVIDLGDIDLALGATLNFASGPPPVPPVPIPAPIFVHRASWQDAFSGIWTNLWREDAWSVDRANPLWTVEPGMPREYSEAELSPLQLQLSPPPANAGSLEIITVDPLLIDITNPSATFNLPDEWIHAVKWAALAEILSSDSQINDPLRAKYAEHRYQQSVTFARDARSILRTLVNNIPLPLDSLASIDAGNPFWRNSSGPPSLAGVLYDFLIPVDVPDQAYGVTSDVVESAPIPLTPASFLPIGEEDLAHIVDYALHVLLFKCGGDEFTSTMSLYDGFMNAIAMRKGVNLAKIRYLTPLFGQVQKESQERPDRIEQEVGT
jgi:hypothetical protein